MENLTHKEQLCLNCKDFYEKGVDEKYNYILISKIVEKTAYENLALSKELAFITLKGMNKSSFDDVEPYLHLMSSLLGIQDSLQEQRFEQILGYPQLIYNRYDNYGLYEGLEEQYYCYESSLAWSDENITILNYIYQNKKKWEVLCSVCLAKLLLILDQNEKALNYVAAMPGPSYIYNSYFDWIKPFVNDYIDEAKRVNYPKYSQEKIEKGTDILKTYNSLENKLEKRHKIIESAKGPVISFISDYESLMIGKTIKEIKLSEEILYKKKDDIISLSIIEYQVYAMDSTPNTFSNLELPAQTLYRNEFQSREIHPDSSFFKMVNSYYWDETRRKKLLKKDSIPPAEENWVDDEEEIKDGNKISTEITDDTLISKPKQNKKKSSKLTIEVPYEKEKVTENVKEEFKESISYEMVDVGGQKEEKNKVYPIINLPIQEINYIRRYVLRNDTLENLRLELKFNNNSKNVNTFYPQAMSKKISMRNSQTIVTLLKKKRNEEWPNNFNMETILEFTDHANVVENANNYNVNNAKVMPYTNSYPADDYQQVIDDYPQSGKKCHLCETYNEPTAEKCKFCETLLYN